MAARRLSPTVVVAASVMMVVSLGIAAWPLWPVYQSPAFIVAVGVSIVVGVAVGLVGAARRWPGWLVMAVTVAAFLVIGVPLGIPSETVLGVIPTPQGFVDLLAATALGWKQLLTIVTPVGTYQALLVPVVMLVLVAAVAGTSTALRATRSELAVIAPLALFIAAILLGPTTAQAPIETALFLGIVLLFWVMWVQRRRRAVAISRISDGAARRESAARRSLTATRTLLGAVVVIAVAAAGGTAAAVVYPPSAARDVLRTRTEQPFDPRDYPSPLSAFRRYLGADQAGATMLTVEGLAKGARIRLAALDSYDGIVYSVGSADVNSASGSFTRVPYRLDQSAASGRRVDLDVEIGDYSGVWVPGAGRLESIRFTSDDAVRLADAFYYNDNAATGAVIGGLSRGDHYRTQAVLPMDADELADVKPGTAVLPPVTVKLETLDDTLASWVDSKDSPGKQLAEVIAALHTNGYISHGIGADEPVSRSGHAADRITQLLTDDPMVGDGEQYAVTAALMARKIGFPARVVLGFAPSISSASGPVNVTGSDISAWIEVQDSSGSWLTVDPNPEPRPIPEKRPDQPQVVSRPQVVLPPPPEDPAQRPDTAPPQKAQQDDRPVIDPFLVVLLMIATVAGWTLLALAVLASPFLAIIAAKLRRRRLRQRAPTPVERIEGGWRELTDLVVDRGYVVPETATRSELATVVGGMGPLVLAASVDRAVFAPEQSSEQDADAVWEGVGAVRGSLDASSTRWQRVRALVSLASFRRYITARRGS